MPLATASEAACMASPRRWTTFSASSNSMTPANTMAVYSPRLRPAVAATGFHNRRRFQPQRFQRRQAGHEQGRLADDGRIELLSGPSKADLRQVVAQDLGCLVVESPGRGNCLGQLTSHANRLGTLTRETERQSCSRERPSSCGVAAAQTLRKGCGEQQAAGEFRNIHSHERETVREHDRVTRNPAVVRSCYADVGRAARSGPRRKATSAC